MVFSYLTEPQNTQIQILYVTVMVSAVFIPIPVPQIAHACGYAGVPSNLPSSSKSCMIITSTIALFSLGARIMPRLESGHEYQKQKQEERRSG